MPIHWPVQPLKIGAVALAIASLSQYYSPLELLLGPILILGYPLFFWFLYGLAIDVARAVVAPALAQSLQSVRVANVAIVTAGVGLPLLSVANIAILAEELGWTIISGYVGNLLDVLRIPLLLFALVVAILTFIRLRRLAAAVPGGG